MAIFNWQDEYSVDISKIDDQHRELVAMIDEFYTAMVKRRSRETLGEILDRLSRYCAVHFSTEEELMQTHGYPYLSEHQEIHQKVSAKVLALQKEFKSGKADLTIETSMFLKDWLDKHILGTDHKYASFLRARGVK